MKIRNGFVSNSSSSSFVIAYKDSESCFHCGRKDLNMLNFFERFNKEHSDSTYLKHSNFGAVIKEHQDEIYHYKEVLTEQKKRPQDDVAFGDNYEEGAWTDYCKDIENEIKEIESFCNEIRTRFTEGWSIIEVQVGNNDFVSDEIIKDAENNGTILTIESPIL